MRRARIILALLLLNLSTLVSAATAVENFQRSWVGQTLALQREIDLNAPLNQATFLGTHNSENSLSYQIPFLRYIDPNQLLSIPEQLDMGMRSLEYDVHWFTSTNLKKDILLSHGLENHMGCSLFDRPVIQGLKELRDWLHANPGEVVLLYFDRGKVLEGHEPRLASYLQEYLGDYIYQPILVRNAEDKTASCVSLPATLTKADILKAGKQLLIVSKACDGVNPDYYQERETFPLNWNDFVFAGIGRVSHHEFDFIDSSIDNEFTSYPDCSTKTVFVDDPLHTTPWRIFEDATLYSRLEGPVRRILDADMKTMVDCGINWQTLDMLSVNDSRLRAAIWSWAPSYPQLGQGQCAIYKKDEGIENQACHQIVSSYACQSSINQSFQIVNNPGVWKRGELQCQMNLGKEWHFATPVNGKQMYLLKQAAQQAGAEKVWLNYNVNSQGHWYANAIIK